MEPGKQKARLGGGGQALGQPQGVLVLAEGLEGQGLPSTPEARLLLSRLHLALGRPQEGLTFLGSPLVERLARGRLLFLSGKPPEALPNLEGLMTELSTPPGLHGQALSLLALAYQGPVSYTHLTLPTKLEV